jgi:hypothetical protein
LSHYRGVPVCHSDEADDAFLAEPRIAEVSDFVRSTAMMQLEESEANYTYWAKMATWTLWEGAALLVGINPRIGRDDADASKLTRQAAAGFKNLYALARRACENSDLSFKHSPPAEWLEWAKSRDLPIPAKLEAEVARLRPAEPNGATDSRGKQIADLKIKTTELAKELATLRTAAAQALGSRERESMLKLIIVMAIAGYSYDRRARRNESTREIARDLEKLGVPLSDDTVRKYLNEGAKLLPSQETDRR